MKKYKKVNPGKKLDKLIAQLDDTIASARSLRRQRSRFGLFISRRVHARPPFSCLKVVADICRISRDE
jgi:hypothetical protein